METRLTLLLLCLLGVESFIVSEDGGLALSARAEDRISIEPPQPSSIMVRSGDNVTLTCSASHPWFLCLWVHPGTGDKLCSIREDGEHETVCDGVPGAQLLVTSDNACHVILTNVTMEDAGDWMCLLSQENVYHTDRELTSLAVATPTLASIRVETNEIADHESTTVDMLEEETVTVVCEAAGGYPQPEFHWSLVQDVDNEEQSVTVLEDVTVVRDSSRHTSTLTYTGQLADHGKSLVCTTRQRDIFSGASLYNISSSLSLSVGAKASPLTAYLTEQQDVLAGVVISIFLIMFCITIIIVFTVRSSKATPQKLVQDTHESYIIFLEEPATDSSNNSQADTADSADSREEKESGIDVSQGAFVSFSSSDLYKPHHHDHQIVMISDLSHHQMISDHHHHQSTSDHHDESSEGCAASDGGLSNISVFDCQHGCFHEDHSADHHYYKDSVLNTDL